MNEKQTENYWNLVPANVLTDIHLSANAKLLYGDIFGLAKSKGYCWASNKYFADKYHVHKGTISRWIKELSMNGYVINDSRQGPNGYERKIYLTAKGSLKITNPSTGDSDIKNEYTPQQKEGETLNQINTPPTQNGEDNITLSNTTNSTSKQQEQKRREHHSASKKQSTGSPNAIVRAANRNFSTRSEMISIECYCGHVSAVPVNLINVHEATFTCTNIDCVDPTTGKPYKIHLNFLRQCREYPPGVIILKAQSNLT